MSDETPKAGTHTHHCPFCDEDWECDEPYCGRESMHNMMCGDCFNETDKPCVA